MERVVSQVENTHGIRPGLLRGLRHQCHPCAIGDQLDDGFLLIQFAQLARGDVHLTQEAIDLATTK
ncbi:hypothetical protein D3C79_1110920 [compost metagenome]